MGEAARLCSQDMDYDAQWISFLSHKLLRLGPVEYLQFPVQPMYLFYLQGSDVAHSDGSPERRSSGQICR